MTQDEIIEHAIQGHASTRDAIRWAMNQERSECERIAEIALLGSEKNLCERVLRAIRNRGKK